MFEGTFMFNYKDEILKVKLKVGSTDHDHIILSAVLKGLGKNELESTGRAKGKTS